VSAKSPDGSLRLAGLTGPKRFGQETGAGRKQAAVGSQELDAGETAPPMDGPSGVFMQRRSVPAISAPAPPRFWHVFCVHQRTLLSGQDRAPGRLTIHLFKREDARKGCGFGFLGE